MGFLVLAYWLLGVVVIGLVVYSLVRIASALSRIATALERGASPDAARAGALSPHA